MNIELLYSILRETTTLLRKGPVIDVHDQTVEVNMMPHESEAGELVTVDCILVTVGVNREKADQHKAELVELLKDYPKPERLKDGPSYIEVGGEIGDQGAAFQLFALGEVLGLWTVITPKVFGAEGEKARSMAGSGMVMISGYPPREAKEKSDG